MAATTYSIIGLPQPTRHARIISISQDQYDCICCVSLTQTDASRALIEIEDTVHREPPFSAEAVYALLSSFVTRYGDSFQAAILLKNREQIISATHNGAVHLRRNEKSGTLVTDKKHVQLIVGEWKKNDVYMVSTHAAASIVDDISLRLQQGYSPDYCLNEVQKLLHEDTTHANTAVSIVHWDGQSESDTKNNVHVPESLLLSTKKESVESGDIGVKKYTVLLQRLRSLLVLCTQPSKKHIIFLVGLSTIVLGVLIASTIYLIQRNRAVQALSVQLIPYHQQVEAIKADTNQNSFEKKHTLTGIISELQTLKKTIDTKSYLQKEVDAEIEFASAAFDEQNNASVLSEIPTFINVRDIKHDVIASEIEMVGNELALVDSGTKTLLVINSYDKSHQLVPIQANGLVKTAGLDQALYILDSSVYQLQRDENTTTLEEIIASDEQLQGATLIDAYDQYLYLLNKQKRNIYRYSREKQETNKPVSWLKSARGLDFSTIHDMAVDGTVWLTTTDGQIYNFLQGNEKSFSVTQVAPEFNSALKLYTTVESDKLYILEPEQRRVVVLTKQGILVKEVKHDSLASATDIVADENQGKIFILNGSLVVEISID